MVMNTWRPVNMILEQTQPEQPWQALNNSQPPQKQSFNLASKLPFKVNVFDKTNRTAIFVVGDWAYISYSFYFGEWRKHCLGC
jgi:hypothetical protein